MSQTEAHQLQITNRALEANVDELKRTIMQLEDRLSREEAESRRLMHLVGDKNEEIDELKAMVFNAKRENVELQEALQRHMSATVVSVPKAPEHKEMVNRWVQTLVEITPPEEVDRMAQQIEELQLQLEQYQTDYADFEGTCIRQTGILDDNGSNRGDSPEPEGALDDNESFAQSQSPHRKPPRLQLNLAIPPNVSAGDAETTVLTARGYGGPNETPRAHIRIPQSLVTSRNMPTARDQGAPVTARRPVNETPRVSQTPRVSAAEIMRRTYVDPTSTSVVGDTVNYADSQSPPGYDRRVSMSTMEAGPTVSPSTPAKPRNVTDTDDGQTHEAYGSLQFRRHSPSLLVASQGTSTSPGDAGLNINGAEDGDIALSGGHMFSIEDADAACPVCSLVEQIQSMYTGKRVCKEAYYAVGWIPEMCHRWSLEHNIAWTIEERAAVATALTNRTKLSAFTHSTHRGPVSIWRKRPFWRSAWRTAYAVLQGVFLYVFNSSNPNEPVVAVIPVRASFIELVTLNGRSRCLQISSLGCLACVGASAGDCVETMTISLDTQADLIAWEKALQLMQRTCAHKCSQKFMNEVGAIREIAEMLLTLAKQTDKKIDEAEDKAAVKA